jgi:hypothetical protein
LPTDPFAASALPSLEQPAEGITPELPLPVLEGACQQFARQWSTRLSERLQAELQIQLRTLSQSRLGAFLLGCGEPTCVAHLADRFGQFAGVVEIPLATLFPMLTRMLGGPPADPGFERRALTDLERRLAQRIVQSMWGLPDDPAAGLASEPEAGGQPTLCVQPIECRTADWRTVAVRQPLLVADYEIAWAGLRGTLRMGLVPERFAAFSAGVPGTWRRDQCAVQDLPLKATEIRVLLARSQVAADAWEPLQVGDVLETELTAQDLLEVLVDGRPAYQGRPGQCDGRKAIRIERPIGE